MYVRTIFLFIISMYVQLFHVQNWLGQDTTVRLLHCIRVTQFIFILLVGKLILQQISRLTDFFIFFLMSKNFSFLNLFMSC